VPPRLDTDHARHGLTRTKPDDLAGRTATVSPIFIRRGRRGGPGMIAKRGAWISVGAPNTTLARARARVGERSELAWSKPLVSVMVVDGGRSGLAWGEGATP
jgi:hypothetical protein